MAQARASYSWHERLPFKRVRLRCNSRILSTAHRIGARLHVVALAVLDGLRVRIEAQPERQAAALLIPCTPRPPARRDDPCPTARGRTPTCMAVVHPGAPDLPYHRRETACKRAPADAAGQVSPAVLGICKTPSMALHCPASARQTPAGHVRREEPPPARVDGPHPLSRPAGTAPPWRRRGSAAGPRRAGPRARRSSPRRPPPPRARSGSRLRTIKLSRSRPAQALLGGAARPCRCYGVYRG